MSIDPAILRAMQANGATMDMVIAVVEAAAAIDEGKRAAKRANNAERQRRFKAARKAESNADNALPALDDVTGVTSSLSRPPNEINSNPPTHTHGENTPRPRKGWVCPEGVEPQHWSDFLENRKRKRLANTQTAYTAQLREIEKFADSEWPPGRIVQHAAERGWGAIFDPRNSVNGQRNGQRPANDPSEITNTRLRAAVELEAERSGGVRHSPW